MATDHPLVLLALNPRNAIVLLVVGKLGALEYYSVGLLRLLSTDPVFFLLGYFYGERVLQWAEARSGRSVRLVKRVFAKARWPLVVVAPNGYVCLLAGATGMSIPGFLALNVVGSIGRLFLLRVLGQQFEGAIGDVRHFLFEQRWLVLGVVVAGIVISVVVKAVRGEENSLTELRELAHELEDAPLVAHEHGHHGHDGHPVAVTDPGTAPDPG